MNLQLAPPTGDRCAASLFFSSRVRYVTSYQDQHQKNCAHRNGTDTESAVLGSLSKQVSDRGAQWPGEKVKRIASQ